MQAHLWGRDRRQGRWTQGSADEGRPAAAVAQQAGPCKRGTTVHLSNKVTLDLCSTLSWGTHLRYSDIVCVQSINQDFNSSWQTATRQSSMNTYGKMN